MSGRFPRSPLPREWTPPTSGRKAAAWLAALDYCGDGQWHKREIVVEVALDAIGRPDESKRALKEKIRGLLAQAESAGLIEAPSGAPTLAVVKLTRAGQKVARETFGWQHVREAVAAVNRQRVA